jgi:transposase-like protein
MSRKRYTPEQIIINLREADVLLSQGHTVGKACKCLSVSDQTYFQWWREHYGMNKTRVCKSEVLETEITHLNC